jgi:hypothetical protein
MLLVPAGCRTLALLLPAVLRNWRAFYVIGEVGSWLTG